jgi:glycosyltransferase involved in cell wall biosynthesis
MSKEIKISVIIPTHNRLDKLMHTLSSLMDQKIFGADYEIIVVDDGSTPPVILSETSNKPNCKLVRLEKAGRSAARNSGATMAQGQMIIFIDDDMQVEQDFLAEHLAAHLKSPNALRIGAIHLPEESKKTPFGKFRHNLEQHCIPQNEEQPCPPNFCAAGNMSMARERFLALDGFDRAIDSGEDQDFALRHTENKGEIVFVPKAEAIHCDNALDIRSYCQRAEWGMKNIKPFCERYPNFPDNIEREHINGAIRFGREPLGLSLRKALKLVLILKPILETLFFLALALERIAPDSTTLDRTYRMLLGAHLLRGYRDGMKQTSISHSMSPTSHQRSADRLEAEG